MRTQVKARKRLSFEEGVAKFESNSNATKITEWRILRKLRVYDRDATRQLRLWLMMIKHDDVGAARVQRNDFGAGRSSTIHRDEQLRVVRLPAALDPFAAEAIAFVHSRRQEKRRRHAVSAEHFVEQRQ